MLELQLSNLAMKQQSTRQRAAQKASTSTQSTPSIMQPLLNIAKNPNFTNNNVDLLLAISSNQFNTSKEPATEAQAATSKTEVLLQRRKSPIKAIDRTTSPSPLDKSSIDKFQTEKTILERNIAQNCSLSPMK